MWFTCQNLVRKTLVLAGLTVAVSCFARQQPASNQGLSQLLVQLHSNEWTNRAKAYEQLTSTPNALSKSEVRGALLDLLDREDKLIESVNRDSEGPSVDEKYGEDFGEYVGELGETVDSFADWGDSHQVCIFVREPYNPESKFAAKIASHAKTAAPCLIQMYGSDVGLTRAEAAAVLAQILSTTRDQLDSSTIEKVRQLVITALHDQSDAVRSSCVRSLGRHGGPDMIPELARVAESDPSPEVHGHSIRKSASEAIVAIQKRAQK